MLLTITTFFLDSTMKLSVIAIICAIASAASVSAQGSQDQQQGNNKPCEGRPEQECKEPECKAIYSYPLKSDGSMISMLAEDRVLCWITEILDV